jgi:hypothetical protein
MPQPMQELKRVDDQAMNGGEVGQRIWERYGGAPGVIPTGQTLGLVRRATRLSGGRHPLLADIQRRWAPTEVPGPFGLSALWTTQPAFDTGAQLATAPTGGETRAPSRGAARPVSAAGLARAQHPRAGLPVEEGTRSAGATAGDLSSPSPAPAASRVPTRGPIQRREVSASSQAAGAQPGAPLPLAPAEAAPSSPVSAASPASPSLGPPIVQRTRRSAAQSHSQRSHAAPGSRLSASSQATEPQPGAPPPLVPAEARPSSLGVSPAASSVSPPLGPAIVQRARRSPTEGLIQRSRATSKPGMSASSQAPGPWLDGSLAQAPTETTPLHAAKRPLPRVLSLLRSAPTEPMMISRAIASDAPSAAASLEMPLANPVVQGSGRAGIESNMGGQADSFNAPLMDMPVITSAPAGRRGVFQAKPDTTTTTHPVPPTTSTHRSAPTQGTPVGASGSVAEETREVEELVEKVMQKFLRRLAIESERRGWRQWP